MEDCAWAAGPGRLARRRPQLGFRAPPGCSSQKSFRDYLSDAEPAAFHGYTRPPFPTSRSHSVLVLPLYHPLRLSEYIAMLNGNTAGHAASRIGAHCQVGREGGGGGGGGWEVFFSHFFLGFFLVLGFVFCCIFCLWGWLFWVFEGGGV